MRAKHLILVICTLSLLFGCKARKVLTTRIDSTGTTQSHSQVRTVQSKVDTGKVITRRITSSKDSSITVIEATPTIGKWLTLYTDGTIAGEFTGIKSTNTKIGTTKQIEVSAQQKGESSIKQVDSTGTTEQTSTVQKKIKSVDAKPKPGIWPLIIPIVILGALLILLWWFFGKPKGNK